MSDLVAMVAPSGEDIRRSKRSCADEGLPALIWAGASDEFGLPGMCLSDMTVKDAVTCFIETEERRHRRRHSPSEGRLCVKTGEMPALAQASRKHRVVASENGGARKQ